MISSSSDTKIKKIANNISNLFIGSKIIPLEEIAEYEGIEVFYDHYDEGTFDGMTVYDEDDFYIHINIDNYNKYGSPRSRFTLAHEFGHYFIDSHRLGLKMGILEPHPSKIDKIQFAKIEREADYFAACLLMPEESFRKDISNNKMGFSFDVISDLSKEYEVSKTACALRFAEIGNHPIKIVYAENGLIKWQHNSNGFPFWNLLDNKIVPSGMLMADYFKSNTHSASSTEQVFAIDCFSGVNRHDMRRMFNEHCIIFANKALSIIWED
ncbi:ImmA/IrrE family metallo-endopeptidase [uncultured Chryseobacterium sp.]|uniref:ImmA/IrrE family metallo-endopeptidase n=1 Tax=uncultured Chryseobacterium sp. TaxID=259322 RepID=UPI00374A3B5F